MDYSIGKPLATCRDLPPNRMPRRLHLDGVEYPTRVFAALGEPLGLGERMVGVSLEIRSDASPELRGDFRHARAVHDGVHVQVRRDVRYVWR